MPGKFAVIIYIEVAEVELPVGTADVTVLFVVRDSMLLLDNAIVG